MDLEPGMLVLIEGLPGVAMPVPEAGDIDPIDLNGKKAQLMRKQRDVDKWIAVTFDGTMITVDPKYVRVLTGDELNGYDFVLGRNYNVETIGSSLAETLSTKGYAVIKLIVPEDDAADIMTVVKRLEDDDQFSRLAAEFERGYLGKDGSGKTLLLDPSAPDAPEYVQGSPLRTMDNNIGSICQMLSPYCQDSLGFDVYSRTNLLLSLPLEDGDDDKYMPADLDDGDAEGYMHTMYRKKLTLLQFAGPAEGALTLSPAGSRLGSDIKLKAEPHTLVIIVNSRYEYTHVPGPQSLTMGSFFLSEPAVFTVEDVSGDMEEMAGGSGPPPPPGEQCTIEAMYCRYGTGADGRQQFWNGTGKAACDGLIEIPFTRWDHSPYFDPDQAYGGAYTRHGCFGIEGVDLFDCRFFEISPAEAKGMDPCQRQVMEVSYMGLLEAGYDKRTLQRHSENIGHFVGIDKDDWMCMSAAGLLNLSGAHGAAAAANAITSNRFSYSLNLKGASMTIDTACSSSLVCTHVGKLHLRFKDFDPMPAAIINGLNLMLYQGPFVGCCAAGMLSHEGRSFTFNATADGYARGELCGCVTAKLRKFNPDTGSICCLAGSQSNQDGRSASLTAPNGPAQEKCINAVLRECHLTPTEVDCFECHGTGTSLGDPIEVGSFRKVMSATSRKEPLVITSSKSNVAHGEGGAGLAGFYKCCLQVAHCEAASNVHLRVKNPHLDLDGFPCQMLSETVIMREDSAYSGVSSFGFGGTNAHGEAWGKNIMTSRGALSADPVKVFEKKLAQAPPAEITMNGDDVNDWDTTGIDPRCEPGGKFKITIEDDGVATWERDEDDFEEFGSEFFIQGSHSNWAPEPLEPHDTIRGLWTATVELESSGEVQFQIIADGNKDKCYYPTLPKCTYKAAKILGPGTASKEMSWLISGTPGDTYRVEFFQQDKHTSIIWLKQ